MHKMMVCPEFAAPTLPLNLLEIKDPKALYKGKQSHGPQLHHKFGCKLLTWKF